MQSVVNLIMSCYELLNIDCMPGMVSMWETNYSDLTFFIDQYRQEIQVQYKKNATRNYHISKYATRILRTPKEL